MTLVHVISIITSWTFYTKIHRTMSALRDRQVHVEEPASNTRKVFNNKLLETMHVREAIRRTEKLGALYTKAPLFRISLLIINSCQR